MKTISLMVTALAILAMPACNTKKKQPSTASSTNTSETPTASTTPSASTVPLMVKPANGVYPPGVAEVNAIILQRNDVTLEKLTEGYKIYSKGECTSCHSPKNIYRHDDTQWKYILDDMATKASLSASQKDAVSNYVFAIRAAKPN